jgi:hypothetical protein
MQRIIVIGTLHAGLTPEDELEELLTAYEPSQVLIEIAQEDIDDENISTYPPEMVFAYVWAHRNGVSANGFDCKINVFREGVTDVDNQALIKRQKSLMEGLCLTWRDVNKSKNNKRIDLEEVDDITDAEAERERENQMLENIRKHMIGGGTILILTGCAHLDFFEENIPNAEFPLR